MLTRIKRSVTKTSLQSSPTDYANTIAKSLKFHRRHRKRPAFASLAAQFDKIRSNVQRVNGRRNEKFVINGANFKAIIFSDCADCEINLEDNCTKVFVERCKNVILRICGDVRCHYLYGTQKANAIWAKMNQGTTQYMHNCIIYRILPYRTSHALTRYIDWDLVPASHPQWPTDTGESFRGLVKHCMRITHRCLRQQLKLTNVLIWTAPSKPRFPACKSTKVAIQPCAS